ncbi:MAG: cysteine--tRNA ligase [Candidatus Shikimatogenerans bostrichidophilus]|nr:MAG: cysteine--tRNA ligase [Candidatus Shikimatogenerans bostrichidophilus]
MKKFKIKAKKNIYIYNSLTRKKELFIPLKKNNINMYVCGPTIYNKIHLGNCRTFIFFDFLYRYFKYLKFNIKYVRNITDIKHLELNEKFKFNIIEIEEKIQNNLLNFYDILKKLNLLSPNIEPRSTGNIIEQIENIKIIIKKNLAYINNGSIYFNINKYNKIYNNYGNILNNININKEFIINNKFKKEKKNFYDFVIWINNNNRNIMKWNSPWGIGYPGWHIGCTTMSNKYLGNYLDIHGGGIDLKFPHHECEISQSNIINDNSYNLSKYWIHTNMLNIDNKKMSKSLNNFIILNDIIKGKLNLTNYKKIDPIFIRLYMLQTHYRKIINISKNSILNTINKYKNLLNFFKNIKKIKIKNKTSNYINIKKIYKNCFNSINDDFNIPLLIFNLFKINNIINKCIKNKLQITLIDLKKLYYIMKTFIIDILGLKIKYKKKNKINKILKKINNLRKKMRKKKKYYLSDKLRKLLINYLSIKDNKIK